VLIGAGVDLGDTPAREIEIRGRVERLRVRVLETARKLPILARPAPSRARRATSPPA
jgi:hypothetical protein